MSGIYWTVGRLHDPKPEDLLRPFDVIGAAVGRAMAMADRDEKEVIAVWDRDGHVVSIFTAGLIFRPA